ncbi:universal stress protein [Natrinema hispanicum]|uniref:Nucleotide-binding universal stress protein, UspA family n=1 Tax=Natrinema hispanicum TaxID=392421 RepID=A0A1G6K2Z9_9EURY|nr:universal stress protein [Natrinema hispanicum]SDC25313.1 Nucleotide-binding universal stress protein, UspA family [Natrinema hispanicum]SES73395.1 Nucleotide-binding universal stress protein, UspA family [Natrinema hispanicum]
MYDTILIPTDGSDHAARAAEHALTLAEWFDATVHAISVVDTDAASGMLSSGSIRREFMNQLEDGAERAVETIETMADDSSAVQTAVLRGKPKKKILAYATDIDAELIVMGTHGRSGVSRFVAGSVTEHVVRRAEIPVLTVRANERTEPADSYDEILVPTDGSDAAGTAVDHGLELARAADARVHAVTVLDTGDMAASPTLSPPTEVMKELETERQNATDEIATRAREDGLAATSTVLEGRPGDELLEYIDDHEIDLVVMGTHGRSGIDRLLLGSTTERLLRHASAPVLAVTPPEAGDD